MNDNLINQLYKKNLAFIFLLNEFLKLKYYFILIFSLSIFITFGYKYFIHNEKFEISLEIQLNPNMTQEYDHPEQIYFAASIVESVNQIDNVNSKLNLSATLLNEFEQMTKDEYLQSDKLFDYYLTNLKDKKNIINSVNNFFEDELKQKSELEKKVFIEKIIFNMNFEVLKFFNMNMHNRFISAKLLHSDHEVGKQFLIYHISQMDIKLYKNISYQPLKFIQKTKLLLKNKIINNEFKLNLEQSEKISELKTSHNKILDDISIAEKLNIIKPAQFQNISFPYPVDNYFKGTDILNEEKTIIERQLNNLEDILSTSEHFYHIQNYKLMLDRLLDSDKEIENDYKNLSLWSKEAIEIKPTITSNLKLIMISLLLSTVVWFISSIFIVIKRNINQ